MSGKLQKELHKARPFDCIQQEAFLNIIRTADLLMRRFEDLLKGSGLSPTQYNVLRILRGMDQASVPHTPGAGHNGSPGVPCKTIAEHMITRDPDITRLLDRLEARSLITRQRDTRDRRVVSTRITEEGLRMLKELDEPVENFHRRQFPQLSEPRIAELIELLEQARAAE